MIQCSEKFNQHQRHMLMEVGMTNTNLVVEVQVSDVAERQVSGGWVEPESEL